MRRIWTAPLLFLAVIFAPLFVSAQALTGWQLVWSDEFNGPASTPPNSTNWVYDLGGGGWGNNELETYTNSTNNAYQDGSGNLVIRALQTSSGGYTSARIKTQGTFSFTYGRIDARIKIPQGQGLWPAFWMLGTDITTVSWPACGEVDIMENIGKEPSTVHGTVHGPGYSGANGIGAPYALPNGQKFSDDYHIFSVIWTSTSVEFFVDSHSYQKVTLSSLPPGTKWVFNTPFFIILNVAVGGGWPGYPDNTTSFPQTMLVDYVRVYQATAPPAINTGGITNGASFTSALSPGSLASVFGTGLSDNTQFDLFDSTQNLFPQASGGTSVMVNGLPTPVVYVSPTQINFQVPWEAPVGTSLPIQVIRNDVASNAAPVTLAATSPSVFTLGNGVAITSCTGGVVSTGSACTLWGNGFGPMATAQQDGAPASSAATTNNTCRLTVAGGDVPVSYCGVAPTLIIGQLNFVYPAVPPGTDSTVSAVLTIGNQSGNLLLPRSQ